MVQIALFTLLFTAVVYALLGLAVLLRTYQRAYGWYFAVTMSGLVLWAVSDIGLLFAHDQQLVQICAQIFYIAPMIIPLFIWFFALSFPENRKLPRAAVGAAALSFAVFSILFLTNFDFFVKSITVDGAFNTATPNNVGFIFYSAFYSVFFILTYVAFIIKIQRLRGIARTQVQYTFYGALFASVPALVTNLSLPMMGVTHIIWLGPFFTVIFAISVAVAIIRHRLFDIRLVLARSVGYILSVISLAVLYGLISFTLVNGLVFKQEAVSIGQQIVFTVLAAGLAFTFHPVRRFFDKVSNRLFYRDAYDPQVFIDQLNRSLVASTDLEHMLKEVSAIIQANLKVDLCLFGIEDAPGGMRMIGTAARQYPQSDSTAARKLLMHIEDKIVSVDTAYHSPSHAKLTHLMEKNNIAVLARLMPDRKAAKEPVGYLILGNKKSGNPFTGSDLAIIEIIVNELVIAIENALRFQEIQRFNATLQHKVDEATRRLRQTNEKLRAMDQTKDDFISMSSHQLRTPLTSVKGYVSMVLEGDAGQLTALQRKLLTQAFVSAQRMSYLISDLLNISRLRTGKFVIDPMPTNLATVVRDEVAQLEETAKGRNLTITYNKPAHFPTYMLDEMKMRQVIMNFMDNAIYYTPGGGRITVNLIEKPQTIEFTVVDNGIGVPKHEQHRLFSKFYRAHNAKRARPDGTGLGLFMAKKVIVAQGGAIIFKSQEDKGSTFGFTFAKSKLVRPPEHGKASGVSTTTPQAAEVVK